MSYTQVELPLMIFSAAVPLLNRSTVSEAPKKKRKPMSMVFFVMCKAMVLTQTLITLFLL